MLFMQENHQYSIFIILLVEDVSLKIQWKIILHKKRITRQLQVRSVTKQYIYWLLNTSILGKESKRECHSKFSEYNTNSKNQK